MVEWYRDRRNSRLPELSFNFTRSHPVAKQEKHGEGNADFFFLQSISFILVGLFNMPRIYDMGPMAIISLRRKACYGFLSPLRILRVGRV
jgi:hypothetical protein